MSRRRDAARAKPRNPAVEIAARERALLAERARLDVVIIGALALVFLEFFVFSPMFAARLYPEANAQPHSLGVFILALAAIIVGFGGFIWAQLRRRKIETALRSLVFRARRPSRPFVLYVRNPFVDETANSDGASVLRPPFAMPFGWFEGPKSIQARLATVLEPRYALVKIGPRSFSDAEPPERTPRGGDWFDDFLTLAEQASMIVISPAMAHKGGVYRVLEAIARQGWAEKTVFLTPPPKLFFTKPRAGLLFANRISQVYENGRKTLREDFDIGAPRSVGRSALAIENGERRALLVGSYGRSWSEPQVLDRLLFRGVLRRPVLDEAMRAAYLMTVFWGVGVVAALYGVDLLAGVMGPAGGYALQATVLKALALIFLAMTWLRRCRLFTVTRYGSWALFVGTTYGAYVMSWLAGPLMGLLLTPFSTSASAPAFLHLVGVAGFSWLGALIGALCVLPWASADERLERGALLSDLASRARRKQVAEFDGF